MTKPAAGSPGSCFNLRQALHALVQTRPIPNTTRSRNTDNQAIPAWAVSSGNAKTDGLIPACACSAPDNQREVARPKSVGKYRQDIDVWPGPAPHRHPESDRRSSGYSAADLVEGEQPAPCHNRVDRPVDAGPQWKYGRGHAQLGRCTGIHQRAAQRRQSVTQPFFNHLPRHPWRQRSATWGSETP